MLPPEQVFTAAALTPEQRIVVQCARALAGSDAEPAVASVLDADPGLLIPLAWTHGMLPYLSRRVAAADEAAAHPSFGPLRAAFLENGVRALHLAGELANVAGILQAAGVVPLAFKGPALAIQAYGDASLRDYGDLDLVVRREELDAAGAALVQAGFQDLSTSAGRAALLREGHHLKYRREGVLVEVHWRFAKALFGFTEEVAGLWDRAEALDIRGRRVQALSVPDHLLALAIHSSRAMWSSLDATVCCVRLAGRMAPEAWHGVAERAREWRCEEALRVSLLLGEHMLGAPYPRELAGRLPPTPGARRLAVRVAAELFLKEFGGPSYLRGQLALRPGFRERVRLVAAAVRLAGARTGAAAKDPRGGLRAVLARPLRMLERYRR
ncbi:MAG TPA: nucleotidyltransferase family protein [Longimicrobium sp.]|nr:nucleotidyltransferase family protein [Longimicrobium sp.]